MVTVHEPRERSSAMGAPSNAEFVGFILHEVRSPLTVILGNAYRLARKAADADGGESLYEITRAAARLNWVLEEWAALSLHPESEATAEPFRLDALLTENVSEHRRLASTPADRLATAVKDAIALGSSSWTEQIVRNLLSNAEKYSSAGSPIEVELSLDPTGYLEVRIRERGIGLPEDIERLFVPFYRSDEARALATGMVSDSRRADGSQTLRAERLWAERRPDGGSDFAFTVPACARGRAC